MDITSGKFVFSAAEAYLIEDGKTTAPLKGASLIGTGPDVLTRVAAIGNDFALDTGIGTCGKNGQGVPVGVGCRPCSSTRSPWAAPTPKPRAVHDPGEKFGLVPSSPPKAPSPWEKKPSASGLVGREPPCSVELLEQLLLALGELTGVSTATSIYMSPWPAPPQ